LEGEKAEEERKPKPNKTKTMQLESKLQSLCANLKEAQTIDSVSMYVEEKEMPINYPATPVEPIPFDDKHKPEMRFIGL
jgi:hypothetical protein